MSLTGKFGNFEIKKTDRISKEDQEWLSNRERMYKRAISIYKAVYDIYKAENNSYSSEDLENFAYTAMLVGDFNVPKYVGDLQNGYISGIFNYFSNKYHVNLENNFGIYDYGHLLYHRKGELVKDLIVDEIDYHTVLDKIFDQLGGLSFKEKAIKEIKDKLKEECYNSYQSKWSIKVNGKKLIYTGGYCSYSYGDYHFNSINWLYAMLNALSYNVYKEKHRIVSLNKLYDSYYVNLREEDFQDGFSAPEVGVEHIKFYKNGRVDITFQSGEFCRDFAREWCGYTLV